MNLRFSTAQPLKITSHVSIVNKAQQVGLSKSIQLQKNWPLHCKRYPHYGNK